MAPGFVLGLTLHEFSHAYVAHRLGDDTAAKLGRLTLNPLKHLDFFGSLMLVFAGFGWAKPVPVDARNFRSPRSDMLWVSLAGPFSNLLLALTVGTILQMFFSGSLDGDGTQSVLMTLLVYTVWINVILAIFNVIPVPPLDGSRIIEYFIPRRFYIQYILFQRFAPMILIGLFVVSAVSGYPIFSRVVLPVARPVFDFCLGGWNIF